MSTYLTGLALRCRLGNPYRKVLLIHLTDRADDQTGITTPCSISYLAAGCEASETTVKKYRRELGPREDGDDDDALRFELLTWSGGKGYGGASVYTIDVKRLKALSEEWTPGDYSSESNRREATIPPEAIDARRPTNGRAAPTNLTNDLFTNDPQEKPDLSGDPNTSFLEEPSTRRFAPTYREHPAVKMYLDAFRMHPDRLQPWHYETMAMRVQVSDASLKIWRETLDDYRSVIGWNPLFTNNLFRS